MKKRFAIALLMTAMISTWSRAADRSLSFPPRSAAPLLYVKLMGPKMMKATFYQGRAQPRRVGPGEVVGLRPGYIQRLEVSGFPERPSLRLYPSLEVQGSLHLTPSIQPGKFPVAIVLNEIDIELALRGSVITKVYYLEDPRKALKEQGNPDRPIELGFPPSTNLWMEGFKRGRPLLIFRLGNRTWEPSELAQQTVSGTVLLSGDKTLTQPSAPPMIRWRKFKPYDPLLGPKKLTEECLVDGGDRGNPVGYRKGELGGFDPEDTIAEYRDSRGRKKITVSNRVCICVPRFGVVRTETPILVMHGYKRSSKTRIAEGISSLIRKQYALETIHLWQLLEIDSRRNVTENVVLKRTAIYGKLEGLQNLTEYAHFSDVTGTKRKVPTTSEKPLYLKKMANKKSARVGEIVTFTLRYANQGGRDITDVVISDSLTSRLEYVPGSAKTSRNAVFTMKPNESGSLILRWEITGKLRPGESGIVTFQARVR